MCRRTLLTVVALVFLALPAPIAQVTIQRPAQSPPGIPPRDPRAQPVTGTARIRGRVVAAATGDPLRRALIRASGAELREGRSTTTDAEGRYELRDLPAGRYNLNVSKGGYVSLSYGQRRAREPGRPIELRDGQLVERVDFSLPRGAVIAGKIVDEFGEPVAGAMVQSMQYRYMGGQRRLVPSGNSSPTPDTGEFRLWGLMPGEYYVSARLRVSMSPFDDSDDRSGYAATYYPGTNMITEAQRVTVGVGQEQLNVNFALIPTRTARITGTVIDSEGRPVTNVPVMLMQRLELGGFMGTSGFLRPDGSFVIANVAPGDYTISIRSGRGPDEGEFAEMPITVTGDDLTGLALVTSRGATARGHIVFDTAGTPDIKPSDVMVSAVPVSPEPTMSGSRPKVNDDWTFEVPGISSGPRLLRANPNMGGNLRGWTLKSVMLSGQNVTDTPVTFKGSETVEGFVVTLTKSATEITGTVADEKGEKTHDFTVVVFARDSELWTPRTRFVRTGRSDQEGKFVIRGLPPEDYLAIALEYHEPGEESDPQFLEAFKSRATSVSLAENDKKTLDLKLVRQP